MNNPNPPTFDLEYKKTILRQEFGGQYNYFREELDPRFQEPLLRELDINVCCDSEHGHDKVTGRSITGLTIFVVSMPIIWDSKRQNSVQTSTFGAEFTALKRAVEKTVMLRYHLRAMGIKAAKTSTVWVDNMAVILNSNNPGRTLNKKHVALTYHFVWKHVANLVINIHKIQSSDNFADPFTKGLNRTEFHSCFYEMQTN
jgi:hypothetical protein